MSDRQLTRGWVIECITGLVLALAWAGEAGAQDAGGRPNILYIMSDDHAAHALSCYGSKMNQTPNLDRLAREGMRFENAFVTNALCGPSRACVLTGKYSHINGFLDNKPKTIFDGSQQTFPKLLQKAGYQTAVIGKWHLGSDPTGFDHWSIMPGQGRYFDPIFMTDGKREVVKGYVTDVITDKALDWLKSRKKNQPFCLMYHHKAPHREWEPDEKHAHLYDDHDIPLPETFYDNYEHRGTAAHDQDMTIAKTLTKADVKINPPAGLEGDKLTEWKYQRFIKDYLRVIASVDDNVGRVLDYLDQNGLAENTIVVYTSDNGFFLGDHGWFDKRFMYEQSLRVPLIVRYPGKVKAGTVSKAMTVNVDYAPTFLDYAGVAVPGDIQGKSLRPILEGKTTPADWRTAVYYHYYEFPQPHHVHPHLGVRTEQYKLMYFTDLNEWEMYDLKKDPNELKNVYLEPEYSEVRDMMNKELAKARKMYRDE
jgi:arylsulfatase A-like enzyme